MKFELRPLEVTDLDDLVHQANNIKIAGNLTNKFPHPYTRQDGRKFLDYAMEPSPRHVLAISIDGRLRGCIGVHPQDDIFFRNAEMGYWLTEELWGQGIMTEAIKRMIVYGFNNFPDIDRIFARPFGSNLGSQKVLEKAGFVFEAKLEKTYLKMANIRTS